MALFYVSKDAQQNGEHEVHEWGCPHIPAIEDRKYLGEFPSCYAALIEAKKIYPESNVCFWCTQGCDTK